jgi:hypothetical protein
MERFLNDITLPRKRSREAMEEEDNEGNDVTEEEEEEEVEEEEEEETHETLNPPAVSVSAAFTKTTEFEWKLTKLPMKPNDVEVIEFETGRDEADDETVLEYSEL